jgi:hypothetical protein
LPFLRLWPLRSFARSLSPPRSSSSIICAISLIWLSQLSFSPVLDSGQTRTHDSEQT